MHAEQTHAAQLVAELARRELSGAERARERPEARKPGRPGTRPETRPEKTLVRVAAGDGRVRAGATEREGRLGHDGSLVGGRKVGLLARGGAVAARAFIVEVGFGCGRDLDGEMRMMMMVRSEAGDFLLVGTRALLVGVAGIGREAGAVFPDQELGFLVMH